MKYTIPKEHSRHPARNWLQESERQQHIRKQSEARFNARHDAEPIVLIRGEIGTVRGILFVAPKVAP